MKNKKTLACLLTLCALMITLSACGTKNPYEDEDKTTYTLAGVTIDIPESMEIDSETSDTALYIEVPDAVLALVKAEVFTNYTDAAAFMKTITTCCRTAVTNRSPSEKSRKKDRRQKSIRPDVIRIRSTASPSIPSASPGLIGRPRAADAVTSPSYNDDLTDLVEYLLCTFRRNKHKKKTNADLSFFIYHSA
jgi:predicted small lipoprotein YifL